MPVAGEEYIIETPLTLGEGIVGRARRELLVVNDYATSLYAHPAWVERLKTYAVVAAPSVYRERLIGVIWVDRTRPQGPSRWRTANCLVCSQTRRPSLSKNARLYEALEAR